MESAPIRLWDWQTKLLPVVVATLASLGIVFFVGAFTGCLLIVVRFDVAFEASG